MKRIVIGTAGHIDHGKTALIKALTGIDCDRLKVEKERGITTELGFAHYKKDKDFIIGIIDVPGHEKFVRHMVAGAWGIDMVLLVVAADEGVMPQTREHVDILELLGLKKAVIAVTKMDLVDREMLELVIEDVRDFLKGRAFEGSPIIPVSSITGENLNLLMDKILEVASTVDERSSLGIFRLPVDRVFSVKGYGTVVTGTCISGKVSVGDQLEIYPISKLTRVRNIQAYYEDRTEAYAGERVALNLQGLEREEIERGMVLGSPGRLIKSSRIDVLLKLLDLPLKPLKTDTILRFHIGTTQKEARIIVLEKDEISPGEESFCQIVFKDPIVALPGDRFIIRGSFFPSQTVGGGRVLDMRATKHKRKSPELSNIFHVLAYGSTSERLEFFVKRTGSYGISKEELEVESGISSHEFKDSLDRLINEGTLVMQPPTIVHRDSLIDYSSRLLNFLEEFEKENPYKVGISKEELRRRLPPIRENFFQFVLERLLKEGKIELEKDRVRLKAEGVRSEDLLSMERKLLDLIKRYELQPPSFGEILKELSFPERTLKDFLERLVYEGKIVKLKGDMYVHPEVLSGFISSVTGFLKEKKEASPSEIKSLFNISRKYLIPLLEYLDEIKVTIRKGDKRVLRG